MIEATVVNTRIGRVIEDQISLFDQICCVVRIKDTRMAAYLRMLSCDYGQGTFAMSDHILTPCIDEEWFSCSRRLKRLGRVTGRGGTLARCVDDCGKRYVFFQFTSR